MLQAWRAVIADDFANDDDDLRMNPGYSHHFVFLFRLLRPDSLDNELVAAAIECAQLEAIELASWDGGKSILEDWNRMRESVISRFGDKDIYEWGKKYILLKPELVDGYEHDLDMLKQALRVHADSYMQQVLAHLTTI